MKENGENTSSHMSNQYHIGMLFRLLPSCASPTSLRAAPSAPLNLTFPTGGVLNDSIELTWLSPQHPSGVIRFYELQQSSSAGDMLVNTTDNITTIVLSNLVPGTQYNFSVRAFTVAFGPFSAQLSVHTADGEGTSCTIYIKTTGKVLLEKEVSLLILYCFSVFSAHCTTRCQCHQQWFYLCVGVLGGACCVFP